MEHKFNTVFRSERRILFLFSTKPELETIKFIIKELLDDNNTYHFFIISDADKSLIRELINYTPKIQVINILYGNVRKFLRSMKIDLICTAHDSSFLSFLFILASKKEKIPTIYIPHGIISEMPRSKKEAINVLLKHHFKDIIKYTKFFLLSGCFLEALRIWLYKILSSRYSVPIWNKICVSGPAIKERLIREGIPREKIIVTGQPRFDKLISLKNQDVKEKIYKKLGIRNEKKLILLTTQPFVEDKFWTKRDRENFIATIVKSLQNLPQCYLVIKVHPRESITSYQSILNKLKVKYPIIKNQISLHELLKSCDLMITVSSTTALEAMILDKSVITINLTGKPDPVPYAKFGAAIGVYKAEDLIPAIRNVLYNKELQKKLIKARKSFVYRYAYIQDGKATKRVIKIIKQILEGGLFS